MDITKEKYFEDEQGYKKKRKIRIKRGDKTHEDKFLEEITHLECSPQFITEQVNPRIEVSNRYREAEARYEEIQEKFEEWKKEKFDK